MFEAGQAVLVSKRDKPHFITTWHIVIYFWNSVSFRNTLAYFKFKHMEGKDKKVSNFFTRKRIVLSWMEKMLSFPSYSPLS